MSALMRYLEKHMKASEKPFLRFILIRREDGSLDGKFMQVVHCPNCRGLLDVKKIRSKGKGLCECGTEIEL